MLAFHGMEECLVDANGRLKLPPGFIHDFSARGTDLVLEFLPEGCLALYPEEEYLKIREQADAGEKDASGFLARILRRQSGGWSISLRITPQGRLVVPSEFGKVSGVLPGKKVRLIGIKSGIEIWNSEAYEAEQKKYMEYALKKRERELENDLMGPHQG